MNVCCIGPGVARRLRAGRGDSTRWSGAVSLPGVASVVPPTAPAEVLPPTRSPSARAIDRDDDAAGPTRGGSDSDGDPGAVAVGVDDTVWWPWLLKGPALVRVIAAVVGRRRASRVQALIRSQCSTQSTC